MSAFARVSSLEPVEGADRAAVGADEVRDEHVHPHLGDRREVPFHVEPADGLAQHALGERHATLPAGLDLLRAGQRGAGEGEVGVHERGREVRGEWADHADREPVAPGVEAVGRQQAEHAGEEARLPDDDGVEGADRRREARCPRLEQRAALPRLGDEARPAHRVVGGLHVTGADGVPVLRGDLGLEREHPVRPRPGVGEAGERVHRPEEGAVRLAVRREGVVPVVALVGQPEAALLEEDEVAVGIARVVVDEQLHEAARTRALEGAEHVQHLGDRAGGGDEGQRLGERLGAPRLDGVLRHEGGVQVADLPRLGAGIRLPATPRRARAPRPPHRPRGRGTRRIAPDRPGWTPRAIQRPFTCR